MLRHPLPHSCRRCHRPPPATDADPFQLGLTLYSASAEFRAGWYDFDGLLDRVAELGIGPGIEIVASQMVPTYPVVSDEFVRTWRAAFERHGFDASSFGANLDMGRRRDRDMTPDEEFEFSQLMFEGAKKLGFPLVRIQSAKPELLRRLLPVAEKLELTLAYEIHAPMGPNAEPILRVRETYAELDSPLLGFVADFSSTMHAMSPTLLRAVQRAGLDDDALAELQRIWATDATMQERQQEFIGYLKGRDFDPGRLGSFAHLAFNMHGHVDPREWADIMPQITHVHAKFYDIDEHGQEPAIDYPELVRVFVEGGYRGYWSSEWEGHAFAELGEVDPLLLVRKQHDLIRASMRALQTGDREPTRLAVAAGWSRQAGWASASTMRPASTKSSRIQACSGSRPCTGCHHSALVRGVASKGRPTTRRPPIALHDRRERGLHEADAGGAGDEQRQRHEALDHDLHARLDAELLHLPLGRRERRAGLVVHRPRQRGDVLHGERVADGGVLLRDDAHPAVVPQIREGQLGEEAVRDHHGVGGTQAVGGVLDDERVVQREPEPHAGGAVGGEFGHDAPDRGEAVVRPVDQELARRLGRAPSVAWLSNTRRAASRAVVVCSASRRANGVSS